MPTINMKVTYREYEEIVSKKIELGFETWREMLFDAYDVPSDPRDKGGRKKV